MGTKVCVDGAKRSTQMKGEGVGRKDEYRDQINKRFRACPEPDAKLGHAVFFEIEISSSTGKPLF